MASRQLETLPNRAKRGNLRVVEWEGVRRVGRKYHACSPVEVKKKGLNEAGEAAVVAREGSSRARSGRSHSRWQSDRANACNFRRHAAWKMDSGQRSMTGSFAHIPIDSSG